MINEITIKNFKSIVDLTLPVSNINVFIGENGCGKTNVLEAIGFASAAAKFSIESSVLYSKGIRNAKTSLIFNSFRKSKQNESVFIAFKFPEEILEFVIKPTEKDAAFPKWEVNGKEKPSLLDLLRIHPIKVISDASTETIDQKKQSTWEALYDFVIYTPNITALRGLSNESQIEPLGINGENLDVLISTFDNKQLLELKQNSNFISWLDDFLIDINDELKFKGYKIGRSKSKLFFKDKYMMRQNNIFSSENANEGILHVLFYISLLSSRWTPDIFAIDNIEIGLNPKLCRNLMKKVTELAVINNKQAFITTHNPAILDGLNLHDDHQRLFVVKRNDEGHTQVERIKLKPETNGEQLKLSEMWMRGYLGGLPTNF